MIELRGSAWLPIDYVDHHHRRVSVVLGELPDADGRVLDYKSSAPNFRPLKGQDVYVMGEKASIGRVLKVEAFDATERVFLTLSIGDDIVWRKCAAGVLRGAQCRIYEVESVNKAAVGDRFSGSPGTIQLVDRPFEDARQLRKAAGLAGDDDPLDRLWAGIHKVEAQLHGAVDQMHKVSGEHQDRNGAPISLYDYLLSVTEPPMRDSEFKILASSERAGIRNRTLEVSERRHRERLN